VRRRADDSAVDYRCGGSAGIARDERTGFPFNATL
jgi:hypothetical protein